MIFNVLTIYKEFIDQYKTTGVIGRGVNSGAISINCYDIRNYTLNKHGSIDDSPYGGGAGMVMSAQPVCDALDSVRRGRNIPVIYFTPRGKTFTSKIAKQYSADPEVILLCGHFEGIDQRAIELCAPEEISMGDYIVTGGHIPAVCFIDSVARYVPGVLGNNASTYIESFENNLLEYDQYTRPENFRGMKVPEVLLSGNHSQIEEYRKKLSIEITEQKRPDLFKADADKN